MPHNSKPKNPNIAHACFLAGYIDPWGSGTLKIIEECRKAKLPDPTIKEANGGIQVSLFKYQTETKEVTPQVTPQVEKLIRVMDQELNRRELQEALGLMDRENFRINYLQPALDRGIIEMTIPDKPNSSLQKYRLTQKGKEWSN